MDGQWEQHVSLLQDDVPLLQTHDVHLSSLHSSSCDLSTNDHSEGGHVNPTSSASVTLPETNINIIYRQLYLKVDTHHPKYCWSWEQPEQLVISIDKESVDSNVKSLLVLNDFFLKLQLSFKLNRTLSWQINLQSSFGKCWRELPLKKEEKNSWATCYCLQWEIGLKARIVEKISVKKALRTALTIVDTLAV